MSNLLHWIRHNSGLIIIILLLSILILQFIKLPKYSFCFECYNECIEEAIHPRTDISTGLVSCPSDVFGYDRELRDDGNCYKKHCAKESLLQFGFIQQETVFDRASSNMPNVDDNSNLVTPSMDRMLGMIGRFLGSLVLVGFLTRLIRKIFGTENRKDSLMYSYLLTSVLIFVLLAFTESWMPGVILYILAGAIWLIYDIRKLNK